MIQFLRDAVTEFKHVSWPTRDQLQKHTVLVLGFVLTFAALIAGIDAIFSYGFSLATKDVRPAVQEPMRTNTTGEAAREATSGEAKTPALGGIQAVDAGGKPVEGVTVTPVTETPKQ